MGNSFAEDKISKFSIEISILPVFKSKFSVPSDLLTTFPLILITDSGFIFSKIEKFYFYFQ